MSEPAPLPPSGTEPSATVQLVDGSVRLRPFLHDDEPGFRKVCFVFALLGVLLSLWAVWTFYGKPSVHCERGGECAVMRQTGGFGVERFPAAALRGATLEENNRGGDGLRLVLLLDQRRLPLSDVFTHEEGRIAAWAEAVNRFAAGEGPARLDLEGTGTRDALGIGAIGLVIALAGAWGAHGRLRVTIDPAREVVEVWRRTPFGSRTRSYPLAELAGFFVQHQHEDGHHVAVLTLEREQGGAIAKLRLRWSRPTREAVKQAAKQLDRPLRQAQS